MRAGHQRLAGVRRMGFVLACGVLASHPARAQNRGVYPLGMSALNAGSLPGPGATYANQLLAYLRDRAKDDDGHVEPVEGAQAVLMDMNTVTWVASRSVKGFRYAASATLPFARNSLTSELDGPINKGGGFADSYYLPLIIGRNAPGADIRVQYGFLAPTGRFVAGGSDNVGSGYWTHTLSSGQTINVAGDRRVTLSAFEMYELHTWQEGTAIRPGGTLDVDGSLMARVTSGKTARLELGIAAYAQRQTSARKGSGVGTEESRRRYSVHAYGAALSVAWPRQRASVGFKYFTEFANRSTYEGGSLQAFGAIGL